MDIFDAGFASNQDMSWKKDKDKHLKKVHYGSLKWKLVTRNYLPSELVSMVNSLERLYEQESITTLRRGF